MAITNTWSITKLDRKVADGYVFKVYFNIKAEEAPYQSSATGTVELQKPDTLIPYSDLTESQIIGWVKDRLNKDSANTDSNIEAALAININEAKAPTIASGVPW